MGLWLSRPRSGMTLSGHRVDRNPAVQQSLRVLRCAIPSVRALLIMWKKCVIFAVAWLALPSVAFAESNFFLGNWCGTYNGYPFYSGHVLQKTCKAGAPAMNVQDHVIEFSTGIGYNHLKEECTLIKIKGVRNQSAWGDYSCWNGVDHPTLTEITITRKKENVVEVYMTRKGPVEAD
jgi:hypothetical protein